MELTRKQIYDMMWTDGVGKTEKALGLKQAELKAICDKFDIPRPSSGYWSALKFGKPAQKTALTETKKDSVLINTDEYIIKKYFSVQPKKTEVKKDPSGKYPTRKLPSEENEIDPLYRVPDILYAKDPIILDTKAKLREKNFRDSNPWNAKNPFQCKADKWLSMRVSQEQEDRALRIYATIIKAARAKGYELKIVNDKSQYRPECTTFIIVRGHEIQTFLREVYRQATNDDGTKDRYHTVGSGVLKFECDRYEHHYGSSYYLCAAQDTKFTKLEEKIQHIIEVLERIADDRDEMERQRKMEEERRRQEEERKRLEEEERKRIQALKDAELEKVQDLLFDVDRWRVSCMIREYIAAFEAHLDKQGLSEDPDKRNEIEWMKSKADFIDPFAKGTDTLLSEEHIDKLINPRIIKTEESKSSYSYYSSGPQYSYWQLKNMWHK